MSEKTKPILCLDFDATIHKYDSPWEGPGIVRDGPVDGAIRWMWKAREFFTLAVFSSRSADHQGVMAMRDAIFSWTSRELGPQSAVELTNSMLFPTTKPPAFLSIDDRAVQFNGNWAALDPEALLKFSPWNKRKAPPVVYPEDLGDDPGKWATAFCDAARGVGVSIEQSWAYSWFNSAIEHSSDVRHHRVQQRAQATLLAAQEARVEKTGGGNG